MTAAAGDVQGRGNRGGGGKWGQLAPTTWKLWGAAPPPPPTLVCQCSSFLFLFVFARELRSLPKKWAKFGEFLVLSRGYLGPRETFAPQHQNSSRAPADVKAKTKSR